MCVCEDVCVCKRERVRLRKKTSATVNTVITLKHSTGTEL